MSIVRLRLCIVILSTSMLPLNCALRATVAATADDSAIVAHYELVNSTDEAVCRPIANLYETDLRSLTDRGRNTKRSGITDFEASHPEEFARIGFIPISSVDTPIDPDLVVKEYSVDLFEEGTARSVVITDKIGDDYRSSELSVLKTGAHYDRIAILNESQPGIIDWYIDPAIIADVPLPKVDVVVSIRPFIFRGSIYFFENQYARLPLTKSLSSAVHVYRLFTHRIDAICNISLRSGDL